MPLSWVFGLRNIDEILLVNSSNIIKAWALELDEQIGTDE